MSISDAALKILGMLKEKPSKLCKCHVTSFFFRSRKLTDRTMTRNFSRGGLTGASIYEKCFMWSHKTYFEGSSNVTALKYFKISLNWIPHSKESLTKQCDLMSVQSHSNLKLRLFCVYTYNTLLQDNRFFVLKLHSPTLLITFDLFTSWFYIFLDVEKKKSMFESKLIKSEIERERT